MQGSLVVFSKQPDDQDDNDEEDQVPKPLKWTHNFYLLTSNEQRSALKQLVASLSNDHKRLSAEALGETQSADLLHKASEVSSICKFLATLSKYDIAHTIRSNDVTLAFILGACSLNLSSISTSERNFMALLMELIYKLQHKLCIAPLSFMRNLLSYVNKDKVGMMKLEAASCPGGSYASVVLVVACSAVE